MVCAVVCVIVDACVWDEEGIVLEMCHNGGAGSILSLCGMYIVVVCIISDRVVRVGRKYSCSYYISKVRRHRTFCSTCRKGGC